MITTALRSLPSAKFSILSKVLICAAVLLPAAGWAQQDPVTNTFTQSTTTSQSVIFSGDGMERFLTRLQVVGSQPPGFDLGFDKAFGDSAVQSSLSAARKVLTDAGVPKAIANQGPVRIASSLTTSGTAGGVTGSQTTTAITTEPTIGPATIFIGNNKTTPFVVLDGTVNFNTNTDTHTTITRNRPDSLLSETYVIPIDFGAVLSLANSGLPVALIQREVLLSIEKVATRDINGRLFRLRAESGEETPSVDAETGFYSKDGKEMKETQAVEPVPTNWQIFATGHFGLADQDQERTQIGFGSETRAGTVGVERRVTPEFTLGLAGTWLENRTDLSHGLGRLNVDGFAVAAYASYVRAPFYADLLYSFGNYEDEVRRHTLYGETAKAKPRAQHHTVEFHTGWNFHLRPVVTGPIAAVSYTNGRLDGYTETGAGAQDTRVAGQDYDSLTSELGWQVSQRIPVSFGAVTWQVRATWEHQYLNNRESVAVGLVDSPFYAVNGSGSLNPKGSLTLNGETTAPDEDTLTAGGGLLFEVGSRTRVMLDYEGYFSGDNRFQQIASAQLSFSF